MKVGTNFTTGDIVKAISEKSKGTETVLSQKDVAATLNFFKEVVCDALKEGQKIQMAGFMSVEPSYRAARKGNNVLTRQPMNIPESAAVVVRAGKDMKQIVHDYKPEVIAALKNAAKK